MKTLTSIGLSKDQALLYITIMQNPEQSVSGLARLAGMGRTKIYRLLDELKAHNLINEIPRNKGAVYTSKSYNQLQSLLEVKESELRRLKTSFASLEKYFQMTPKERQNMNITLYEGIDGLKQVVWNTTKAQNVLKVFEVTRLNIFLDFGFAEDVRMQYVKNKIKTKDLTNEEFIPAWTNITEYATKYSEYRFIDPKELEMSFEIYIYNDTVTLLDAHSDQITCIEIQNPALKLILEQLFDFVWARGRKMHRIGERGEMKVEEWAKAVPQNQFSPAAGDPDKFAS